MMICFMCEPLNSWATLNFWLAVSVKTSWWVANEANRHRYGMNYRKFEGKKLQISCINCLYTGRFSIFHSHVAASFMNEINGRRTFENVEKKIPYIWCMNVWCVVYALRGWKNDTCMCAPNLALLTVRYWFPVRRTNTHQIHIFFSCEYRV